MTPLAQACAMQAGLDPTDPRLAEFIRLVLGPEEHFAHALTLCGAVVQRKAEGGYSDPLVWAARQAWDAAYAQFITPGDAP